MRKLRCFLLTLFAALMFTLSTVTIALAHPGRTDANGGHTDSSTGEYHYHHGYSAHQHYDIDGDGLPDCPYNFDDKTGQSSGSSSNSSSGSSSSGIVYSGSSSSGSHTTANRGELSLFLKILLLVFFGLPLCYGIAAVGAGIVFGIIAWIKRKRCEKERFAAEKSEYEKMYAGKDALSLVSVPSGDGVDLNGNPCSQGTGEWGSKYTFYVCPNRKTLHKTRGCSGACHPINAASARHGYVTCKRCKPELPDLSWYTEYRRITSIKKKYRIE